MTIHKDLADGRWYRLSLAQQLGNVGSEFYRARKNESALPRFLELMDLTVADPRWAGRRRRELARVRERACEELRGGKDKAPSLQAYFDQFALLARSRRK